MRRNTIAVAVACGLVGIAVGTAIDKADASAAPTPTAARSATPSASPDPTPSLSACANEDGSGGPLPCRWNASTQGNGVGLSYTLTKDGLTVYDMPKGWPHVGHELADALAESGAPHADTYRWEKCVVSEHTYRLVICPNGQAVDL